MVALPSLTLSGDVAGFIQSIEKTTDIEITKRVSIGVIKAYASSQQASNGIITFFLLLVIGSIPVFLSNWLLARKIEKHVKEEKANNEHT